MKKLAIFAILIIASVLVLLLFNFDRKETSIGSNMKITSSAFLHNTNIPSKYTCDGENVNPPLQFLDVPESTKSLVLIVDDPDAPAKTWVHWVVYNINPSVKEIAENSVPQGSTEGVTDFGKHGYGGPCPPSGTHGYFFKLYALDFIIPSLDILVNKEVLEKVMKGHIIDKSELIGFYSRD